MTARVHARCVASRLSCLAALALICDSREHGAAVTSASLADDLKGRTAAQIQQRLMAYGVESTLDSCADLQLEVARQLEHGAAALLEPHNEHAAAPVDVDDRASTHEPSLGPAGNGQREVKPC